ncbi:MAG: hypothetical protein U0R76_07670 [Candidatus Nanopelagicales bacterium]
MLTATLEDGTVVSTGSVPDDEAFTSTVTEGGVVDEGEHRGSVLRTQVLEQAAVVVLIADGLALASRWSSPGSTRSGW